MVKKYLKKIIAQSPQDLQVISACCEGGKIKIDEIKYLPENKISHTTLFDEYKNKLFRPSDKEISQNIRSRSAKLRFITRSKNDFFYPNEFKEKFLHYLELENKYV